MYTDYYDVELIDFGERKRLRLVTYDGDAPKGTVKDIVEVDETDGKGLGRLWRKFVDANRLPLFNRYTGEHYPYRGKLTFAHAVCSAIKDNIIYNRYS